MLIANAVAAKQDGKSFAKTVKSGGDAEILEGLERSD
jgi:hypothetical protein